MITGVGPGVSNHCVYSTGSTSESWRSTSGEQKASPLSAVGCTGTSALRARFMESAQPRKASEETQAGREKRIPTLFQDTNYGEKNSPQMELSPKPTTTPQVTLGPRHSLFGSRKPQLSIHPVCFPACSHLHSLAVLGVQVPDGLGAQVSRLQDSQAHAQFRVRHTQPRPRLLHCTQLGYSGAARCGRGCPHTPPV